MARLPEIQPRGAVIRGLQSSVSPAEVANPFRQIAQGLESWSDTLAAKNVADAQDQGANAVYRDADGNLRVDTRSNISASGRAYNAAAQQGYMARVAGDIRTRLTTISNDAKGNIDNYDAAYKSFRDQTLTAVPKEFRGAVTTMFDSEAPRFRLGVSEQKRTADIKEFEGNIKSQIQLLDDDASTLARSGGVGTEAYKEKQAQIKTLYQSLADNPDFAVGQQEADIALKRMESRHMADAMLGQVDAALNSPSGLAKARDLANAITTDTSISLTPAERRQYAGLANERINGFVAQTKANLKPVQDQSTAIQKRLKEGVGLDNDDIDTTARTLAAGGDLSGAMELYNARAVAKTLQGFRASDNPQQVAMAETAIGNANRPAPTRDRPVSFNPDANSRMQDAVAHLKARGMTDVQAAGIVGNLMQESSLNPFARNKGDGTDGSDSIGIGQWNGDRARALKAFAQSQGTSPDDLSTQLDFIVHELQTTEGGAYQRLQAATNVDEATAAMISFERPQGWSADNPRGGHGWNNRLAAASRAAELAGVDPKLIAAAAGSSVDPEVIKEYRQEITSDAKDLFAGMKAGFDKGLTPAVSDINLLSRQLALVDDQDFRKQVSDYFTSQSAVQAIGGAAPAQLESLISSLQADAADGATLAQQQILTGLQDAQKAQQQALKDDPIGYAARKGMVSAPPALDLSNPDSWAGTFSSLQNAVDVLASRGIVSNISALRPEMQGQVARALENSTPEDSVKLLGSMAQNMSPETFNATLSGLYSSGQARAAAAAGALVAANPEVAEGVLRGQQLLKENPLLAPKKTDTNTQAIDDLLPPRVFAIEGVRQTLLDTATARYADLSNQIGDTSGELNDTRMEQAIKEVTGGVLEMNGAYIVAPRYSMSQDDFDQQLAALSDADLNGAVTASGQRVTARDLRNEGRLRAIADGRYLLEFGSADAPAYVMRQPSQGNYNAPSPFVLDLRGR
ncbi:phage tail tip lysozyme [Rhizobium leguminosarum]|uniref:phage tail tip lysozyme n=1 Tax=Rhizobium leguminosarum TaxID=384 RepID=UPI00103C63F9|nr:phage tail tip lysozyme [Rhizobium leguminosarum]TBY41588.1 hypothetical protein E0H54_30830 [Rhizobium leguminosarum bv. viciae]